jgi:hypothetical protein
MPAFCTHYLFLKEMEEFLKEKADFKFDFDSASIGTQGPDIFFFHRILPIFMLGKSQRKVGSALHRAKPSEIFDAFNEYCKFSPNIDIAKSYIYGFIMHYALDRRCHPYVYSLQEKILSRNKHLHKSSAHNRIEMAMDTYLLNKYMGYSNPADFDSSQTITNKLAIIDEISHLLAFVIPKVTDKHVSERDISKAISDTRAMQRLLRDRSGILRAVARIVETIFAPIIMYFKFSSLIKPKDLEKSKKYGNINRRIWVSPYDSGTQHNESFEDLFELACDDAKDLICGFNEMCQGNSNGYDVTKDISFLTGIEVD